MGTRACKAGLLLDFLQHNIAQNLYLVGDILDGWSLGSSWYWSDAQTAVVEEIRMWQKRGCSVVLLPGNHDEGHYHLVKQLFGAIPIAKELLHRTAEGTRMLVVHGHQFDTSLSSGRWPSLMGSQGYAIALRIDQWHRQDSIRFEQRTLRSYLRSPFVRAVHYLTETKLDECALVETARRYEADGVICGHTHQAGQHFIGDLWYINDGDWVQSCTALVEDHRGALQLIRWQSTDAAANLTESEVIH